MNKAATGVTVKTAAGKQFNPLSWEHLPHDILGRMALKKLERKASLKEWRTMSCILHHYTDLSLDDFQIPTGTHAMRRVLPGEYRIKKPYDDQDRYFIRAENGTGEEVLPRRLARGSGVNSPLASILGPSGEAGQHSRKTLCSFSFSCNTT